MHFERGAEVAPSFKRIISVAFLSILRWFSYYTEINLLTKGQRGVYFKINLFMQTCCWGFQSIFLKIFSKHKDYVFYSLIYREEMISIFCWEHWIINQRKIFCCCRKETCCWRWMIPVWMVWLTHKLWQLSRRPSTSAMWHSSSWR